LWYNAPKKLSAGDLVSFGKENWTAFGHYQVRDGIGRHKADCVGCGNYFNVKRSGSLKGFIERFYCF